MEEESIKKRKRRALEQEKSEALVSEGREIRWENTAAALPLLLLAAAP